MMIIGDNQLTSTLFPFSFAFEFVANYRFKNIFAISIPMIFHNITVRYRVIHIYNYINYLNVEIHKKYKVEKSVTHDNVAVDLKK
jgi:hypothetical protein